MTSTRYNVLNFAATVGICGLAYGVVNDSLSRKRNYDATIQGVEDAVRSNPGVLADSTDIVTKDGLRLKFVRAGTNQRVKDSERNFFERSRALEKAKTLAPGDCYTIEFVSAAEGTPPDLVEIVQRVAAFHYVDTNGVVLSQGGQSDQHPSLGVFCE